MPDIVKLFPERVPVIDGPLETTNLMLPLLLIVTVAVEGEEPAVGPSDVQLVLYVIIGVTVPV